MKTAIRIRHLSLSGAGHETLGAMEKHGKRQDASSAMRKVRDVPPLVWGGLNLRERYDAHMDGVGMQSNNKRPVMHALVQWPTNLAMTEANQKAMLGHAVAFFQSRFGGDAVFAARLDRDEAGQHTVDVFLTPKYQKKTAKSTKMWASTSKHLKELCVKHSAEIERRMKKPNTTPRAQGMALQSEWREYLETRLGLTLEPKNEKSTPKPDRVDPEAYKQRQEAQKRLDEANRLLIMAKSLREEVEALREDNMRLSLRNQQLEDWANSIGAQTPRPYDEPESP